MGQKPYRVNGSIDSEHNWLTVIYFKTVVSITAWYNYPVEFIQTIRWDGYRVEVIGINQNDTSCNEKCWTCGKPIEMGQVFCNPQCEKAVTELETQ